MALVATRSKITIHFHAIRWAEGPYEIHPDQEFSTRAVYSWSGSWLYRSGIKQLGEPGRSDLRSGMRVRDRPPNLDRLDSCFALQLRGQFVLPREQTSTGPKDEKELGAAVIKWNEAVEMRSWMPVDYRVDSRQATC